MEEAKRLEPGVFNRTDYGQDVAVTFKYHSSAAWTWAVCGQEDPLMLIQTDIWWRQRFRFAVSNIREIFYYSLVVVVCADITLTIQSVTFTSDVTRSENRNWSIFPRRISNVNFCWDVLANFVPHWLAYPRKGFSYVVLAVESSRHVRHIYILRSATYMCTLSFASEKVMLRVGCGVVVIAVYWLLSGADFKSLIEINSR